MPRSALIARASVVAALVSVALLGCSSSPTATATGNCDGQVIKVLLGDESSTTPATYRPADISKIFAIPATPVPTCFYSTVSTPAPVNGVSYTVTHRTLVYLALSTADADALVSAIRKTASVAPWTSEYDDGPPAVPAPTPTPSRSTATSAPTAAPVAVSSSALWQYNLSAPLTAVKGEMGYYFANPLTSGTAVHAGLSGAVNLVRIEIELREPR